MTFVTSRNMSPKHVALCTGSRPVGEEYVKKAALRRAAARLGRYAIRSDKNEKLDPMAVLEEAMQHFYRKAKIEEMFGRFCDFRIVDNAMQNAARIAREIVSIPASAYQCHKAGCGRSECGSIAWGHDSGRDA